MGLGTGQGCARFREIVCRAARHPGFIHHRWYVEYHLVLVERIALELCGVYPDADRGLVQLLVWLHDYGKIVDRPNEHAATLTHGRAALVACGFGPELVARALHYYELFERYDEVARAPLEVRIASSADGAAHLVGPFYAIWWHEHPERDIPTLMADNRRKALVDWDQKIVLPEVRAAFATRHRLLLEDCGDLPSTFLDPDAQRDPLTG